MVARLPSAVTADDEPLVEFVGSGACEGLGGHREEGEIEAEVEGY